jgi:predicted nucleic acid-binding protein
VIVVDVNVVVHLLTGSGKHEAARALWDLEPDWRLPALWRHEFLNVLATLAREGFIGREEADQLWKNGLSLFTGAETAVPWSEALDLAIGKRISAYDAQYVALARSLRSPLVTEDAKLRKAFPDECVSLETAVSERRQSPTHGD